MTIYGSQNEEGVPRCEVVCTKRKACQSCQMFSEIAMFIIIRKLLTCQGHPYFSRGFHDIPGTFARSS